MPTKAVVILQTAQDSAELLKAYIAIVMGVYGLEQTSEHIIFPVTCPLVCSIFILFNGGILFINM